MAFGGAGARAAAGRGARAQPECPRGPCVGPGRRAPRGLAATRTRPPRGPRPGSAHAPAPPRDCRRGNTSIGLWQAWSSRKCTVIKNPKTTSAEGHLQTEMHRNGRVKSPYLNRTHSLRSLSHSRPGATSAPRDTENTGKHTAQPASGAGVRTRSLGDVSPLNTPESSRPTLTGSAWPGRAPSAGARAPEVRPRPERVPRKCTLV